MQVAREQSWRIEITAKAKNFNLRFRATSFAPTWTLSLCRLSIVLKVRKFIFRINSEPTEPKKGAGFMTTKVMNFVHKFRARLPKNRPIAPRRASNLPYSKDPIRIGFWVMGFLVFLAQSISKKDQKGIMVLASVGFCIASLFKKFKTVKLRNIAAFLLVVATLVCYLFFLFSS